MRDRTISNAEMERRKLLAAAQTKIAFAMHQTTEEHGELTANEWTRVLIRSLERINGIAVNDEWNELDPRG